jgi:hypothetical protein
MRIKNLLKLLCFVLFVSITKPAAAATSLLNTKPTIDSVTHSDSVMAQQILQRVAEIQSMDKSNLSSSDKAKLRAELQGMRADMGDHHGVYISVGAAIIIILLLILILR